MKKLFKRIAFKLARRTFVRGFDKYCTEKFGRALVYFKTEEFLLNGILQDFSHTNNWESYELACVLNRLGFVVDVIDRTAGLEDIKKLEDIYDIFIGIGAGDSGKFFPDIAAQVPKAIKVLYAMGPEPDLSDRVTRDRHNYFRARHPEFPVIDRRLVSAVDTKRLYAVTDAIISIGTEWSFGSYTSLGKDLYKIYLSTYPGLSMSSGDFSKKDPKKFLYFGGSGNIVKGMDLAIETFAKRPDLELYIGGPSGEEDFNAWAKPIVAKCPNIHMLGFMDVTSQSFRDLTAQCGYVIMPSASEGCATSITTCMRRGLIPVATIEDGIELGDYGYLISGEGDLLAAVEKTVDDTSRSSKEEFMRRVLGTYAGSAVYTAASFSASVEKAILEILYKQKRLVK